MKVHKVLSCQMSKNINFVCPKCGNKSYETGEIRTTGGFISKVLDVQNKKFTHVTCKRCKYTELLSVNNLTSDSLLLTGPISSSLNFFKLCSSSLYCFKMFFNKYL